MKRLYSYPLLLVLALVLDRVVISMVQIDPKQSLRPLFILLSLCLLASFLIQRFVKDWHRTDFLVFMLVALFVIYRPLYSMIETNLPRQADFLGLALMLVLAVLYLPFSSRKFWLFIRKPVQLTNYFNLFCMFLLIFQVVRLGQKFHAQIGAKTIQTAIAPLTEKIQLKSEVRPDIYVIILDGYGRQDVLESIYEYDNSKFIGELEKRGFDVSTQSHSNYLQTPYSMASLWNFDYVQPWSPTSDYRQYLVQPIQNNRVFRLLDEIGYTTVSFEGTLGYTQIDTADVFLSNFLPLNHFETLLLIDSPLESLSNVFDLGIPVSTYKAHETSVSYKLEALKEVPASIPGPKIVYDHILIPHPPFIFDRNGNVREQRQPYKLWDDGETAGGEYKYQEGYREQVAFVNKKILESIDAILAKSETPPIILVMGDHGPASMFRFDLDSPGCIWERASNLYALHLPGHQTDGTIYATITPVNTFRVIFDTYFGTELPLLEDRTYLAASTYKETIKDITGIRDSREGCMLSE